MSNRIVFRPNSESTSTLQNYPLPSKKFIPDWYKTIPPFTSGDTKLKFPSGSGMPNSTLKKCIPFLDAMTCGYTAYLEEDVYVEIVDGAPFIRWRSADELISLHTVNQFENFPIPNDYHHMVAKWTNNWTIQTPKNYSVLFSHPANRIDLPFFTLSGLVNCDLYILPIQFPFILKKGFEGIIPNGTPVCQLNFIKNEPWKTNVLKFSPEQTYKNLKLFYKTFVGSYKKNFWKKHRYE